MKKDYKRLLQAEKYSEIKTDEIWITIVFVFRATITLLNRLLFLFDEELRNLDFCLKSIGETLNNILNNFLVNIKIKNILFNIPEEKSNKNPSFYFCVKPRKTLGYGFIRTVFDYLPVDFWRLIFPDVKYYYSERANAMLYYSELFNQIIYIKQSYQKTSINKDLIKQHRDRMVYDASRKMQRIFGRKRGHNRFLKADLLYVFISPNISNN